ncbi:uncharacterized protein [Eurosta solidaginis]|uniref:uncharacterized protein isoform X2 n=1 Tax=Eurosta solidaginis TaxID=178769 RepID=UPI0035305E0C
MSGLEKFQANKAWRAKVKKLLVMQRKATTPAKEPVSCQRISLDLEEDLQTLLEARAAPHVANVDQHESNVAVSGNAMNKLFEMKDENKSNNANTIKRIPYNFSTKASCGETIFVCQQQRTSDESFWLWKKCVIKQHPILTVHYLSTYIARTRIWLKKMLKSAAPMETILKSLVNKNYKK